MGILRKKLHKGILLTKLFIGAFHFTRNMLHKLRNVTKTNLIEDVLNKLHLEISTKKALKYKLHKQQEILHKINFT